MDKQPNERNKYLTAAILVAIVVAILFWTFTKKW